MNPGLLHDSACRAVAVLAAVFLGLSEPPTAHALGARSPLWVNAFNRRKEFVTHFRALDDRGYSAVGTINRGTFNKRDSKDTTSITANHATSGAAISRIGVSLPNLLCTIGRQIDIEFTPVPLSIVSRTGYASNNQTYHTNTNLSLVAGRPVAISHLHRFYLGRSYLPNSFGRGRRLVDQNYATGEEESPVQFYALRPRDARFVARAVNSEHHVGIRALDTGPAMRWL